MKDKELFYEAEEIQDVQFDEGNKEPAAKAKGTVEKYNQKKKLKAEIKEALERFMQGEEDEREMTIQDFYSVLMDLDEMGATKEMAEAEKAYDMIMAGVDKMFSVVKKVLKK